jgi:hypothetical protein
VTDRSDPRPQPPGDDPVLVKRERIRRLSDLGSRIGYSCFGGAVVLFVVAFILDFPSWLVTVIVALMAVGSVTLLPAIVFGYGVKAADAEDRGEKFGY